MIMDLWSIHTNISRIYKLDAFYVILTNINVETTLYVSCFRQQQEDWISPL